MSNDINSDNGEEMAVGVFLRCRPFEGENDFLTISLADSNLEVSVPDHVRTLGPDNYKYRDKKFHFHGIFDEDATQADVYEILAEDCVTSVVEGINATIFAYGQSGSGKTYAINGVSTNAWTPARSDDDGDDDFADPYDDEQRGIVPRVLEELFSLADARVMSTSDSHEDLSRVSISNTAAELQISMSFLEIYNDTGRDLLRPRHNSFRNAASPTAGELRSVSPFGDGRVSPTVTDPPIVMRAATIISERRRMGLPQPTLAEVKQKLLVEYSEQDFLNHRETLIDRLKSDTIEAVQTVAGGVECRNLSVHPVATLQAAMHLFNKGNKARTRAVTSLANRQSRAHVIFTLFVESRRPGVSDSVRRVCGTFHLPLG